MYISLFNNTTILFYTWSSKETEKLQKRSLKATNLNMSLQQNSAGTLSTGAMHIHRVYMPLGLVDKNTDSFCIFKCTLKTPQRKKKKRRYRVQRWLNKNNFSKPTQVPFTCHMYPTSKTTLYVATPDAAEKLSNLGNALKGCETLQSYFIWFTALEQLPISVCRFVSLGAPVLRGQIITSDKVLCGN